MTKILYMLTEDYLEEPVYKLAEEIGVEVILFHISRDASDEEMKAYISQWEDMGVDIILCRGSWSSRLSGMAKRAYVMPLKFSFETTIAILCGYRKENPGFFGAERRKVLLISSYKLPLNMEILDELFNAEFTNVCFRSRDVDEEMIELARGFDLVICGNKHNAAMRRLGINSYYQVISENQTLHDNFVMADILAQSRKQLQEKNDEIRNILDNSFNAVISMDREGIIRQGNGQLKRYFKRDLNDIIGKSIYEFIPSLEPGLVQKVVDTATGFYGELVEFDNRILVMNSFPVYSKGTVSGAALHFEELRQIERVEQKIKAEFYNKGLVAKYSFDDIIGQSQSMEQAKSYAREFAKHSSNVLIYGESGTGKELFAQSIHNQSSRKNGSFVAVNCGALPNNLLESELFGYVGGAFTGASKNGKKGLMELAHKGTIFLDEISEMDLMGQVRLLRVLEERVISRIGDDRVIPVDVRIVAASNKNLKKLVEEGKFRVDLYYRLNVLMLKIPPLREREGDIEILTDRFIQHFGELNKKQIEVSREAMDVMVHYPWRGNVRQLRNFCERLVIISNKRTVERGFVIQQLNDSYFEVIGSDLEQADSSGSSHTDTAKRKEEGLETGSRKEKGREPVRREQTDGEEREKRRTLLAKAGDSEEKQRLLEALNQAKGRRDVAAELMGISKTSLWRRMKKFGIEERY